MTEGWSLVDALLFHVNEGWSLVAVLLCHMTEGWSLVAAVQCYVTEAWSLIGGICLAFFYSCPLSFTTPVSVLEQLRTVAKS